MKHEAPPIIGLMDFFGLENNIILIEHDDELNSIDVLGFYLNGKDNIIFQPKALGFNKPNIIDCTESYISFVDSISQVYKMIRTLSSATKPQEAFHSYLINRIDFLNLDMDKKKRGSQMAAFVSMLASKKILLGANLLITSGNSEHKLREIANKTINIKTQ